MVLNDGIVGNVEQATLTEFDVINDLGFSTDGSEELPSSDTLAGEFLRKVLTIKDKDTVGLTYEFDALLGLTEGNGNTLQKFGLFTAISGDNLKLSKVLADAIAKTADREINVGYQISVEVEDLT